MDQPFTYPYMAFLVGPKYVLCTFEGFYGLAQMFDHNPFPSRVFSFELWALLSLLFISQLCWLLTLIRVVFPTITADTKTSLVLNRVFLHIYGSIELSFHAILVEEICNIFTRFYVFFLNSFVFVGSENRTPCPAKTFASSSLPRGLTTPLWSTFLLTI